MVGDIRDKITSPFKTITTRNYSKPTHVNNVHGGGKKPRKQTKKSYFMIKQMKLSNNFLNYFFVDIKLGYKY